MASDRPTKDDEALSMVDEQTGPPVAPGLLRGRAALAIAAVAVGLIAAVVIVSVSAASNTETADEPDVAGGVDIADDDPDNVVHDSTAGDFDVVLRETGDGVLALQVADPSTPVSSESDTRHCALVTLDGPANLEAFGCVDPTIAGDSELRLSSPGDPRIGCAAIAVREQQGGASTLDASSEFTILPGDTLPNGTYDVTVEIVSGFGDGCSPADGEGIERIATASGSVEVG
ncbi:MAG: hypothetical protein GY812_07430 [Actinomycetia bacterium]|nr:hypothetical protein [Actinomycetes bacterium]